MTNYHALDALDHFPLFCCLFSVCLLIADVLGSHFLLLSLEEIKEME